MPKTNPTHTRRAARKLQAETGLSYTQALAAVRAHQPPPAGQHTPLPAPVATQWRFEVDYRILTAIADPPKEVAAGTVTVFAADVDAALAAAATWVEDNDYHDDPRIEPLRRFDDVRRVTYYVESGTGERLSEDLADEDTARALARRLGERLVECQVDRHGDIVEDTLRWDYGALGPVETGAADPGATEGS